MKATVAHGTRCNRVPCCVGKIRPDRFAYVGMLAIQPFRYAQDVVADFHHPGRCGARQDLARALNALTAMEQGVLESSGSAKHGAIAMAVLMAARSVRLIIQLLYQRSF